MKFFIILLCLAPLVFSLPAKEPRGAFGDELKHLAQKLVDSGVVTGACDTGCHAIAGLLGFLCGPACKEAEKLLHLG